jgi:hypothetical protein
MEGSQEVGIQTLLETPDEKLQELMLSVGIFGGRYTKVDEDGFPIYGTSGTTEDLVLKVMDLQRECWKKYNTNPQISTAISDNAGIVCGKGFTITSPHKDVRAFIKQLVYDSRNRLYANFKKFYTRSDIEGELFLSFTVHTDGFVEIDFMHPEKLEKPYFHPSKSTLPLFYAFKVYEEGDSGTASSEKTVYIPSIYVFEFPSLIPVMEKHKVWKTNPERAYRKNKRKYKKTGGYQTFIVSWDKSLFTERNVSQMSTTIEWANHYENLKRYEIDHKRSSGSYLWAVSFEDVKAFKTWMSLTPEQKEETGIKQKKTPGGTIVLPPGMKLEVKNPQLPKISDSDTDILHMITSGLNKPEDMVTGQSNGTYGSVKASRGPESDRNRNKQHDFEIFLRYDFFRPAFLLNSAITGMEIEREEDIVEDFKDQKEVFGKEMVPIWESMEVVFPSSEVSDMESATKGLMGVKHGSLADTLGVPLSAIAEKLGFTNYRSLRAKHAVESKKYPELSSGLEEEGSDVLDAEQESKMLEKKKTGEKDNEKKK